MTLPLLFLLLFSLFSSACEALDLGDHVCAKIEKYQIPVTVTVSKPYKIRENYWCPKFPPRCTREKTEFKTELQIEQVTKTRLVNECCKGYLEEDNTCVASCAQGCGEKGVCIAPDICKCHADFYGPSCDKVYELVTLRSSTSSSTTTEILSQDALILPSASTSSTTSSTIATSSTSTTTSTTTTEAPSTTTTTTEMPSTSASNSPLIETTSSEKSTPSDPMEAEASDVTYDIVSAPSPSPPSPSPSTEPSSTSIETTFASNNSSSSKSWTENSKSENSSPTVFSTPADLPSSPLPFHPLTDDGDVTPTFGSRGYTSVIVVNNHSIHTISTHPHPKHQHSTASFLEDNVTLFVILAAALSLIVGTALTVLVCQQLVRNGKKKQVSPQEHVRHLPPLPTAISLDMSSTPTISFSAGCDSIDLQPAIYTMGTFKPTGHQPTISQELRQALEATYDHPPSQSRSCRSSEGQRSLAEMWEAVMSASKEVQLQQQQNHDEEHLYQEIPCYHPRLEVSDSRC